MKVLLPAFLCGSLLVGWLGLHNEEAIRADESSTTSAENVQPKGDDSSEKDSDRTELGDFMRQKLESSNQILEGLVTNDFELVQDSCDELLEMSEAESWRATNDMMYMQHSREFRNSVRALRAKSKKKSPDGAALAWLDVTMECIKCHEWVRDTMLANVPAPNVRSNSLTLIQNSVSGGENFND